MDTKLKNKHRAGTLVILSVIILASAAMIGLYPYIERQASGYLDTSSREESRLIQNAQNMAPQLMNVCYSLWQEQVQEENGRLMTPSEVFLPGYRGGSSSSLVISSQEVTEIDDSGNIAYEIYTDGVPSNEVYDYVNEMGENWKTNLQELRPYLSYEMKDQNGQILRTNITEKADEFWKQRETGAVDLTLSFQHSGNMTLDFVQGDESTEVAVQALSDALSRYYYDDPIRDYSYDYATAIGTQFSGPKDVSYTIRMAPSLLAPYEESYNLWDTLYAYLQSGGFLIAFFGICAAVALAALILPCFSGLGIQELRVFHTPLEIVLTVGFFMAAFMLGSSFEFPLAIMIATFDGSFLQMIQEAGFSTQTSNILMWTFHGLMWFSIFALFYWGITCLRSLFSMGLWRCLKERTLIGRLCCFIKRCWDRFYQSMKEVDWQDTSSKVIIKIVIVNFILLAVISCFWFFGIAALILYSIALFFLLKKYWKEMHQKYEVLLNAINQIAEGDLNVTIQEPLGIFEPFRSQLEKIQQGFKKAVDSEVTSQRMKTELITNVSHDLKTPLTAIITYVNLLKQEGITEEQRNDYIQILDQKSMRLKVLIEDLFEVSKATSGSTEVNLVEVDIVSLMKQVRLELDDQLAASGLDFRWNLPEERIPVMLDSQKTYRVFANLLINITKYALPGTRAYIDITRETRQPGKTQAVIALRNISATELHIQPGELTERFVRGDAARNTDGSGLGLAIAKSFVELQNGEFTVETEADLFRVVIRWNLPDLPVSNQPDPNI
ncbi:MAG: sensor histidine kinase [Lachnospiraceae bacterium]